MNGSVLHDHEDSKPTAKAFSHALSTLRDLRSLKLTFDDYYWEDDRLSSVSKSLSGLSQHPFEHLSDIGIRFASFKGKTLCHFFYNQGSILRQLTLHRIVLVTVRALTTNCGSVAGRGTDAREATLLRAYRWRRT